MLYKLAAVLAIVWLIGVIVSFTVMGFIHILLIIAIFLIIGILITGYFKKLVGRRNKL